MAETLCSVMDPMPALNSEPAREHWLNISASI